MQQNKDPVVINKAVHTGTFCCVARLHGLNPGVSDIFSVRQGEQMNCVLNPDVLLGSFSFYTLPWHKIHEQVSVQQAFMTIMALTLHKIQFKEKMTATTIPLSFPVPHLPPL